jgi:3-oxoadipate enol-lactonase
MATPLGAPTIARLKNIQLAYHDSGQGGIPLLLIHGFCGSSGYWQEVIPALSAVSRVIAPDLRGHGQSSAGEAPCSMDDLADDLLQLLDHLNIPQAVVFGHSLGGYITLSLAERYPQRLLGLTLVHSTAHPDAEAAKLNRDKGMANIQDNGIRPFVDGLIPKLFASAHLSSMPEHVDYALKIGYNTSAEGAIHALQAMRDRPDRNHVLEQFQSPILLIAGEDDQVVPADKVFSVVRPSIQTAIIENAGHMGMLENPEALIQRMIAFISELIS